MSADSDITSEELDARLTMHSLFVEMVDLPSVVRGALTGADTPMSDTLFDFTAQLHGRVYRFPCPYADLILSGWEIAPDSDITMLTTIAAQSFITVPMENEGETVTFYVANQTASTIYAGAGMCVGGIVRSPNAAVTLAGGITAQSTAEDVLAAYGTPTADETAETGRKLTYQASANNRISFLFSDTGTQIVLFTLKKQTAKVQPAELFTSYRFTFTLEGRDYALPTRLDSLLNNGWTIAGTQKSTDAIAWYESRELTLQKGTASVDVVVNNLTMGDLRLYAASVTGITLDNSRAAFALTDVRTGVSDVRSTRTYAQILTALGEPSDTDAAAQTATYRTDDGRSVSLAAQEAGVVLTLQAAEADDEVTGTLADTALRVNVGGNAYTLPADASLFRDNAWIPQRGWQQLVGSGSFVQMDMEGRRAETVTAYFINTGADTQTLATCRIGGLYAGPGAADIIISRSVQQEAEIAEAFNILGIPAFDLQDGGYRYLVYGTSVNHFLCLRCSGDLIDALWIVCFTYH